MDGEGVVNMRQVVIFVAKLRGELQQDEAKSRQIHASRCQRTFEGTDRNLAVYLKQSMLRVPVSLAGVRASIDAASEPRDSGSSK